MQLIRTNRGVEAVVWEDDSPVLLALVRPDEPFELPDASAPVAYLGDRHGTLTTAELVGLVS